MWYLLVKLTSMKKIGGSHTEIKNITKGLPSSITSNKKGKKIVKKAIKELVNKRFLFAKPPTQEIHVSLNPKNIKKIRKFIEENK